jgi:SSS family solute:Na+ symporter
VITGTIIGLAIYLAVCILIGWFSSRRIRTSTDFIVAGRRLPLWILWATTFATFWCAGVVMGAAEETYNGGIIDVIADPYGGGLCLILTGVFFIRAMRRMKCTTPSDYYEARYNKTAGFLCSLFQIACYIGGVGYLFVAFGQILRSFLGISLELGIIIGAAVVFVYVIVGGMFAIALTDFVQMMMIIVGLIVAFPLAIKAAGGWSTFVSSVPPESFQFTPGSGGGVSPWIGWIAAWAAIGLGNIPGGDTFQRNLAAKNESVAVWGLIIAGILYLIIGNIPVLLGIMGKVIVPGLEDSAQVLPQIAKSVFHPVVFGIFIASLVGATMSSSDSYLLVASSAIGRNVYRFLKPSVTDKQMLRLNRIMIPVCGILSIVIALYMQSIYDLMVYTYELLLGGLFAPLLLGIFWKKANSYGAIASMVVGGVVTYSLFNATEAYAIIGCLAGIVTIVIVSLATQKIDKPKVGIDIYGNKIEFRHRLGFIKPDLSLQFGAVEEEEQVANGSH